MSDSIFSVAARGQSVSVEQYRAYLAAPQKATPGRGKKRNSPEEDLHRVCMDWVNVMQINHSILAWMVHVPNGGKRPRGEAGKLKAMGAKPGFPDLFLPKVCSGWKGLAIELKSPIGKLSDAQKGWLAELQGEGYLCQVCRTFGEFEAAVQTYLGAN